jgi:hypothetical protein
VKISQAVDFESSGLDLGVFELPVFGVTAGFFWRFRLGIPRRFDL